MHVLCLRNLTPAEYELFMNVFRDAPNLCTVQLYATSRECYHHIVPCFLWIPGSVNFVSHTMSSCKHW